jgi:hypothetical protein
MEPETSMKAADLSLLPPGSFADEATRLERTMGRLIAGLALLFLAMWGVGVLVPSAAGPEGDVFALFGGLWLLPIGLLLIGAARATRRQSRYRWLYQSLPLIYVLGSTSLMSLALR